MMFAAIYLALAALTFCAIARSDWGTWESSGEMVATGLFCLLMAAAWPLLAIGMMLAGVVRLVRLGR